jgi:Transposase
LSGGLHITRTVPDDEEEAMIAVGVDTHKERHHALALDLLGQLLGELSFAASAAGYAELQRWAEDLGEEERLVFGIEGAGSWGAGLCEHLQRAGHTVVEVERPRRRARRAGKSDRIDALAAAKSVLGGENTSTPRSRGILSALRVLLVARRSTTPSTPSRASAPNTNPTRAPTSTAASAKERPSAKPCAPSNATSPAPSSNASPRSP